MSRRWLLPILWVLFAMWGCDRIDHPFQPLVMELNDRPAPAWYDEAKLGIFIHWGPYAIPGRGEWYWYNLVNSPDMAEWHAENYGEDFAYEDFGPMWKDIIDDPSNFDADDWADLFAAAGAQYVVLTTKHHDGFLLWPSGRPNPFVPDWRTDRDLVGELADAVRARDLRFGAYYSGGHDWTFRMQVGSSPIDQLMAHLNTPEEEEYIEAHYRELIGRYHPSVLWNDISFPAGVGFDRKWGMVRDYYDAVPEGLIDDRFVDSSVVQRPLEANPWLIPIIEGMLGWKSGQWSRAETREAVRRALRELDLLEFFKLFYPPHYDFQTQEFGEVADTRTVKWERCLTLGGSWGYNRYETADDVMSGEELIHRLVDIVSKGGNLLVNVGPTADGIITDIQQEPLLDMGEWLAVNGEAIYGTRSCPESEALTGDGREVRLTCKPDANIVYATVLAAEISSPVRIRNFAAPDAVSVELLGSGPCPSWDQEEAEFVVELPEPVASQSAYVLKISFPSSTDDDAADDDGEDDDSEVEIPVGDDDDGDDDVDDDAGDDGATGDDDPAEGGGGCGC